jgi:hypothetical protein
LIALGLVLTAFLVFIPFKLIDSRIKLAQIPSVESQTWFEKPSETIKLQINNEKIIGLAQHKDLSYIEFILDREAEQSTLSIHELNKLKVSDFDLDYLIEASEACNGKTLCLQYKLTRFLKLSNLILKDNDRKDFIVSNLSFKIDEEKNILGKDFIDLFLNHYNFYDRSISFNLFEDEKNLLEEFSELSEDEQDFKLLEFKRYLLRVIRSTWYESLKTMSPEDLAAFMLIEKPIKNKINLRIDLISGFPIAATLINPSELKIFNDYCKKFLKEIPSFKNISSDLKKYKQINLEVVLEYSQSQT